MPRLNKQKKKTFKYSKLESGIRPVAYSEKLHVPLFTNLLVIEKAQEPSLLDHNAMSSDKSCSDYKEPSYGPQHFNQSEQNDLVRYLCLSKD